MTSLFSIDVNKNGFYYLKTHGSCDSVMMTSEYLWPKFQPHVMCKKEPFADVLQIKCS